MKKKENLLEEKIMPVADKIANNRYLIAIRDGFMLAMPLLIIGAISLLIEELPIPGYGDFMSGIFGKHWGDFFLVPYHASMAIMSIFVIIGISHSLTNHYKQDGLNTAVISLVSFFVLTPFVTNFTPEGSKAVYQVDSVIPMEWIGSKGLFVGMVSAILATEIMRFVSNKGWVIKMPEGVPPTVAKAFSALIPGTITIFSFGIIRLIFAYTPFGTIHNCIFNVLQLPLVSLGDSLGAVIIANFFIGLFWMFGIAGGDVVQSVMTPIWLALSADNLLAFGKGEALPHIITQQFNSIYLWLGGGGATLGLCLALLLVCKSQQCKRIGKLSILPGLFNINEPIIFGLPVVLNPILLIPFICTPLILAVITYCTMAAGLVPAPNGVIIPWTTPPIIGGFLVSGIRGAILQAVEIVISFLIYLPFIKAQDKKYCEQEKLYENNKE
ncbi:PTS cellobiose transporter subunit IIC [Caproiciproducens galactitolivorans]|uniref:Permease IIC component n=1 Tax=Caproiciproducens galactitolivorans TaxID=642589 RepID=A0A4Z0YJ13_9FIRM|nr:PTS cellobiose transporter subunit IIC [Caproiciproducens galactitolivorans]QEY35181.1 PTS cellobiose transporter subunit IIC [Caproiciproducens galactitolivorans]TGJ76872.1 lichenan permease IIC component [Caproiciproducens galactitolivorans]